MTGESDGQVHGLRPGHSSVRITGKDDNEFVTNVQAHLWKIHPGMPLPPRVDILKMAKEG
jgi:hypothetical protein